MIGIHDCGGFHNLGPINPVDDEVFHERWEGMVFSMLFVAAIQGTWALDEFRHEIELMPADRYLNTMYYVHWLESMEELVIRDGHVTRAELEERQKMVLAGTLPEPPTAVDPEVLEKLRQGAKGIAYVGLQARRPDGIQNYKVGDKVTARLKAVPGHTRLPRFVWGKTGTIVSYAGTYPMPDTIAHRKGENPEPSYTVVFDGKELWGEQAEPNSSVVLDLFESYMDPATDLKTAA
ncbi:nitrile hydratase subunit beta [Agrobacterium sp. NPDC090273]|uniref:nitrile hydratase subunit beta n=1 Tax=Agrobacterium sp. NPDC090273 TaxID=3363919 RepID=UPI00383BB075